MLRTLKAYHIYIALHNYLKMIRHVRHRLDNLDRIDQYPTSLCHGAICYLRESGARVDEVKSSLKPTLAPLDASLLTTTLLALEKERPVPAADDPIRHTELHYEPHADSPLEQHHRVGHAGDKAVRELQPATDIERPALRYRMFRVYLPNYLRTYAPRTPRHLVALEVH